MSFATEKVSKTKKQASGKTRKFYVFSWTTFEHISTKTMQVLSDQTTLSHKNLLFSKANLALVWRSLNDMLFLLRPPFICYLHSWFIRCHIMSLPPEHQTTFNN